MPVDVPAHEMPRVQFGDYFVEAENLPAAYELINERAGVADAAEVWGTLQERAVIVDPLSRLNHQEVATLHLHWTLQQSSGRYQLLHEGPVTLQAWASRRLEAYVRAKYPDLGGHHA